MTRLIAFYLAFILLSGCALFSFSEEEEEESLAQQAERKAAIAKEKERQGFYQALRASLKDKSQKKITKKKKKARQPLTRYVNKVWLGDKSEFFTSGQQNLPDTITHQQELVFTSAVDLDIHHIANRIAEMAGMPVLAKAGYVKEIKLVERARLNYRGSLIGLLDLVAGAFEASWSYDRKSRSIIFTRLTTRAFDFYAPLDEIAAAMPVVGKSAAASTGISRGKGWRNIKNILTSVMPEGSQIDLSPEVGKITVTTTPSAMRQVAQLIEARNRYFNREIHLNVQVLSFDVGGSQSFLDQGRLDIAALLDVIGLGDTMPMLPAATPPAATPSAATPSADDQAAAAKSANAQPEIKLTDIGVDKIIGALRKIGKISVLANTDTRTRDGKITPIKSTSQRAYLPRPTAVGGAANPPTIVTTGFSMNLRSRVLPHDRVQINMSMALRILSQLKSLGAAISQIQVPEISTRSWAQETIIPDGSTLLVSGFEHDQLQSGAGVQEIQAGQDVQAPQEIREDKESKSREIIIILITPTIVDMFDDAAG